MGVFESTRLFPGVSADLNLVAADVEEYFRTQQFEASKLQTVAGGWQISIRKGGIFKSVLGLKTALNVEIETFGQSVRAKAGIGIFGQVAIPVAVMYFIAWPVLLTQIWGLVQQANLDDEAMGCIERSLANRANRGVAATTVHAEAGEADGRFCVQCGGGLQAGFAFCPQCGGKAV